MAGTYLCKHQDTLRATALATIQNAPSIENEVIRGVTIAGAQGMLAALAACPVAGVTTPPGVLGG